MSPRNTVGVPPQRRPGARIGLILLVLLATVLVAGILIQRESPTTTILVTDLRDGDDVTKRIEQIQKTRGQEDIDIVLFVRSVADPTPQTDKAVPEEDWIWLSARDLVAQKSGAKPWLLVASGKNAADVQETLKSKSSVRVASLEEDKIQMESRGFRLGLLPWVTWAWVLALLVIGALFGRILLPRAQRAGPRDVDVGPSPAPEHQPRNSAQRPEVVAPARDRGDLDWPRAGTDTIPRGGVIDLRRFHKRSTIDSWTPQCPYCAAFDVQASDRDGSSHYRCGWCAEEWQVRAGEPWPTVVIRPRHRAD